MVFDLYSIFRQYIVKLSIPSMTNTGITIPESEE